jgi:RNA polymerase sigma-70 factor (ECF subfamily)
MGAQPPGTGDWSGVVQAYGDMVYRLAYARTGNRHDADDIFQEVFLRYAKKHPAFESEEHRKAWLIRVTVSRANSLAASLWRKRRAGFRELPQDFSNQEAGELAEALGKLPEKYRQVLHLFYYEDLSVEGIASLTGQKPSTVRSQLTRGRGKLKDLLEGETHRA